MWSIGNAIASFGNAFIGALLRPTYADSERNEAAPVIGASAR